MVRTKAFSVIGLILLTLAGGWLRLTSLDSKSVTHPEMYVPGIHMAEGLSEPHERLTLPQVLTGTFSSDTHPPGYYVMMWGWTKVFGAGLVSMRMPSALLGTVSIPLLFWLACLAGQRKAGWIASACLAFSGYHVFWSRVARMFALECFLGLLATILLLILARSAKPRPGLLAAYIVAVFAGLTGHIFFWTLLFTHTAWVVVTAWSAGREFPGILKAQLLTAIAGSPLLAFAAYQQGNTLAVLSDEVGQFAREYLQFAFVFPSTVSGFFPTPPDPLTWTRVAVMAAAALLLVASVARPKPAGDPLLAIRSGPPLWTWGAAGVVGCLTVGAFIFVAYRFATPYRTIQITKAMAPLPLLLAGAGAVFYRLWPRLGKIGPGRSPLGPYSLVTMMALVPFAVLTVVSAFKPILNQRGMAFTAPYLLLALATGAVWIARKRWMLTGAVAGLALMCAVSLREYSPMTVDPANYRGFASVLARQVGPNDLVFIVKRYDVTPMLYYLNPQRFHLVASNYEKELRRNPDASVWALSLYNDDIEAPMKRALAGYRPVQQIQLPYAKAWRFEPMRDGALAAASRVDPGSRPRPGAASN